MNFRSYRARDTLIFCSFVIFSTIILGYQLFIYYSPIWTKKVPTHWSGKAMANDWMFAYEWYFLILIITLVFCGVVLSIGYILSKFFLMGTKKFRYSPFTLSFPLTFTFFFFFAGINESVYASYLAKGIMSNTSIGIIYFIVAGISLVATLLCVLVVPMMPQDDP